MFVCAYVRMCVCSYVRMFVCMYVCMYVCVCVPVCVVCMCVFVCVCVRACVSYKQYIFCSNIHYSTKSIVLGVTIDLLQHSHRRSTRPSHAWATCSGAAAVDVWPEVTWLMSSATTPSMEDIFWMVHKYVSLVCSHVARTELITLRYVSNFCLCLNSHYGQLWITLLIHIVFILNITCRWNF